MEILWVLKSANLSGCELVVKLAHVSAFVMESKLGKGLVVKLDVQKEGLLDFQKELAMVMKLDLQKELAMVMKLDLQ